jgi:hypothetical protein
VSCDDHHEDDDVDLLAYAVDELSFIETTISKSRRRRRHRHRHLFFLLVLVLFKSLFQITSKTFKCQLEEE